jgi:DNA-directed RNA polymerase specialized sigma24 family protein
VDIPDNMTEEETLEIIQRVVDRTAPKYTFYGYTASDMKQEAFIICMDALSRYDGLRPLENFLAVHLSNRIKNFVRDKHFTQSDDPARQNVIQPAQLDDSYYMKFDNNETTYEDIDYRDMTKLVDKHLPAAMRLDYLKMVNDVYIPKPRRQEIKQRMLDILEENGYYEEG